MEYSPDYQAPRYNLAELHNRIKVVGPVSPDRPGFLEELREALEEVRLGIRRDLLQKEQGKRGAGDSNPRTTV